MPRAFLALFLIGSFSLSPAARAQERKLTAANLPEYLSRYQQNFGFLEAAYGDLAIENVPLLNEQGKPLGRRLLEDRQKALSELRQTVRQLAANPQDLVQTITLFVRTEALSDDLLELSQIAYDNDREELGKRFSDLQVTMEYNKSLLESHVLRLAAEKQARIRQLEIENQELQRKLKEAAAPAKSPGG
jgi:hypothetical protein